MARKNKVAVWRFIKERLRRANAEGRHTHAGVWYTLKLIMVRELIYV